MAALSRRTWLKLGGTGLMGAAISLPKLSAASVADAAPPTPPTANSAIYRFRIGAFEAASFLSGFMDTKPSRPAQADEAAFQSALKAIGRPAKLRYPFNVLYLSRGAEKILIDAGPPKTEGKPLHLLTSLAALGVSPTEITHVFLTHAHFDHMGGLLDELSRPVFDRAEHFCLPEEIAFWTAEKPDFSKLGMKPGSMHASARRILSNVRFTPIDASARLPEGITPILSPGHTPGHMTLRIESRGEALYHISDLTHHAMMWLPHPEWSLASDIQPEIGIQTRTAAWAELASSGTRVFGFHLPFPGLGRIMHSEQGYRWVAEDWEPLV